MMMSTPVTTTRRLTWARLLSLLGTSLLLLPLVGVRGKAQPAGCDDRGPGGVGVATGFYGTLMRTTDGGQSWTEVSVSRIPNHDAILNAAFVDATSPGLTKPASMTRNM